MITVGLVQADIKPYNKAGNLSHYTEWLKEAIQEPVHLLVFPEMFNCGFSPNIREDAEPHNGSSLYFLYLTAHEFQCDVVATLPVLYNNILYNRLVWLSRDRILGQYDKHHLFMGEEEFFTPGTGKTIGIGNAVLGALQTFLDKINFFSATLSRILGAGTR